MVQHALRCHGVADDGGTARPHDAGLLPADGFAVRSQELRVVDVDAGDDRAVGIHDIGRVEAAAQAHLQDGDIQARLAHEAQDGERGELEVGQGHLRAAMRSRRLHGREVRDQIVRPDTLAPDAAALLELHEVRRGIDAGAVARLQRHRLQHGAGGTLAVRAGHRDDGAGETQPEPARHLAHPLQAHVDGFRVDAFAMGQPAVQGVESGVHRAGDCRRGGVAG